jgi:hypothetical protein
VEPFLNIATTCILSVAVPTVCVRPPEDELHKKIIISLELLNRPAPIRQLANILEADEGAVASRVRKSRQDLCRDGSGRKPVITRAAATSVLPDGGAVLGKSVSIPTPAIATPRSKPAIAGSAAEMMRLPAPRPDLRGFGGDYPPFRRPRPGQGAGSHPGRPDYVLSQHWKPGAAVLVRGRRRLLQSQGPRLGAGTADGLVCAGHPGLGNGVLPISSGRPRLGLHPLIRKGRKPYQSNEPANTRALR